MICLQIMDGGTLSDFCRVIHIHVFLLLRNQTYIILRQLESISYGSKMQLSPLWNFPSELSIRTFILTVPLCASVIGETNTMVPFVIFDLPKRTFTV